MKKSILLFTTVACLNFSYAKCSMNYEYEVLSEKVSEVGRKNLGISGRNLIRKVKSIKFTNDGSEQYKIKATFLESLDNANTDRYQALASLKLYKLESGSKLQLAQLQGYGPSKSSEKSAFSTDSFKTAFAEAFKSINTCAKIESLTSSL